MNFSRLLLKIQDYRGYRPDTQWHHRPPPVNLTVQLAKPAHAATRLLLNTWVKVAKFL